jgi:hypothetical protein
MEERIRTEHNKDQPKKNTGNHGGNFHGNDAASIEMKFNF